MFSFIETGRRTCLDHQSKMRKRNRPVAAFLLATGLLTGVSFCPTFAADDLKDLGALAGKYAAWADLCDDPAGADVRSDFLARVELLAPDEQTRVIKKFERRYTRKTKEAGPLLEKCILEGETDCCTRGPGGQFKGAKERYETELVELDPSMAPAEEPEAAPRTVAATPPVSQQPSSVEASPPEKSDTSAASPAAASTPPVVSGASELATSAAVCDVQALTGEEVVALANAIIAPATSVPQEFAQFSGKWIGEWDEQLVPGRVQSGPLCAVLVITTVDADGRVRGVYSMGRQFGIEAQITDGKFTFGRSPDYTFMLSTEIDGQIAGLREYIGRTSRITMENVASPAAAPTSPAVSDTSAASQAAAPTPPAPEPAEISSTDQLISFPSPIGEHVDKLYEYCIASNRFNDPEPINERNCICVANAGGELWNEEPDLVKNTMSSRVMKSMLGRYIRECRNTSIASAAAAPTSAADSDTSAASPAVATTSTSVSGTSALAPTAAECDPSDARGNKVEIIAPAPDVPPEFAKFSGMWTGTWDIENGEPVCGILVISKMNAGGHFEAYFGMGDHIRFQRFRSSVVRGQIKYSYHAYMLNAGADGTITGEHYRSDREPPEIGRITMEKVENP